MPKSKKEKSKEMTFSSVQDFEMKMFPRAVATRSLQQDGSASRALGERLAEALALKVEERLLPNDR